MNYLKLLLLIILHYGILNASGTYLVLFIYQIMDIYFYIMTIYQNEYFVIKS